MDGLVKKKTEKNEMLAGGSLDVVAMVDEDLFISGSDTGCISLWNVTRKKPIFTKFNAHGTSSSSSADSGECCWVTALSCVAHSDLFASGSGDGFVKLWKLSDSKKSFSLLLSWPVEGFVNSLQFFYISNILYLAIGIGQEHRLGRWWRYKNAKNHVKVIRLG